MRNQPNREAAREALREFCTRAAAPDPAWELCCSEAKDLRVPPACVWAFKQRHKLLRDQRLSDATRALLEQELETANRCRKGQQIERGLALALIAERATPEAAAALAAVVPCSFAISYAATVQGVWVSSSQLEAYLLNRVEALTGKRYQTAGAAWKRAAALVPAAVPAAETLMGSDSSDRDRLILFWGVVLRLDQLEGPPPANPVAFYRWCLMEAYQRHIHDPLGLFSDVMTGRMRSGDARNLLGLPVSDPLDPGAIRSAYRAAAREHHPDAGGDRRRFEQLSEARDRLLLEVAP